jgi:hypothetical protein
MLRGLQGKIVKFTKYSDSGKWRGTGVGKVMIVERGEKIVVSIREHHMYKPQQLVEVFPWETEDRYRCDVILSVKEE